MDHHSNTTRTRRFYLGVALGDMMVSAALLYVLYRTVVAHDPALLVAAVAFAVVLGWIGAAIAYRHYRWGRNVDTAWLGRAMSGLAFVVLVLVLQQVWATRRHLNEVEAEQRRLQEVSTRHR
jgi:heme exporter protein D